MAKQREVEQTVTLTSPYGAKVTVSASRAAVYQSAGYKAATKAAPPKKPAAK